MTEIYPVAQSIIDDQIASEREVCEFLEFARSPFQRWKMFDLSPLEEEDKRILPLILRSFHAHHRRYGSRRIADELRDQGICIARRRVTKLMNIAGISAIQPKSFKPRTTESRHSLGYNDNLIMDLKEIKQPNRLWVGDITYIPIQMMAELGTLNFWLNWTDMRGRWTSTKAITGYDSAQAETPGATTTQFQVEFSSRRLCSRAV